MRTHKCGELNKQHLGETVECAVGFIVVGIMAGLFLSICRDRAGLVQVVVDPDVA